MATIGFIRHGVTDWNHEQRAQGMTDIPLNAEGRRQAQLLAERLRGERWELIYTSDLIRARETAETVAAAMNIPVVADPRLREIRLGRIEGTTEEERVRRWGADWHRLDLGMEPKESAGKRGLEAVLEAMHANPGKRILFVSHGGLIKQTLLRLVPHIEKDAFLHNTSVTVLQKTDEGWECALFNCNRHLDAG